MADVTLTDTEAMDCDEAGAKDIKDTKDTKQQNWEALETDLAKSARDGMRTTLFDRIYYLPRKVNEAALCVQPRSPGL